MIKLNKNRLAATSEERFHLHFFPLLPKQVKTGAFSGFRRVKEKDEPAKQKGLTRVDLCSIHNVYVHIFSIRIDFRSQGTSATPRYFWSRVYYP